MQRMRTINSGIICFLAVILVACGGSSDGGINYSGKSDPAVLTADNDGVFGTTMLEGSATNKNASPFPGFAAVDGGASYSNIHLALLEELAMRFQQDVQSAGTVDQANGPFAAIAGVPDLTGTCGGTVTFSGNENAGSIAYNDFCVGNGLFQMTFNGSMSYVFETINTSDFKITVNFSNFTVTVKRDSDTWSETSTGSITILKQGSALSVTFSNLFERDGKVYKIEDLSLSGGFIKGRLYHPEHGYVDITTEQRFTFNTTNGYCGGTLKISGVNSNGAAISSTMVVANDCSSYTITHASGASDVVNWH